MRLSQLIFVPAGFVACFYLCGPEAGMEDFVCFLVVLGFLMILLAPNISYFCGAALSNFLDPQNWTSAEEEMALRPIRRLIDKDQYSEALTELEELLKNHKPTYEALLIKAKLLHHFGSVDETVATLLSLISLSRSTAQQLAVMELLAILEGQHQDQSRPLVPTIRHIEIHHELVLFPTDSDSSENHKEIPPGSYRVQETIHRQHRWLKLAEENWGNAEMCWQALVAGDHANNAAPKRSLFRPIVLMHQAITKAIEHKPRRFQQAEAKQLFKQASQFIRSNDWQKAVPLLQQASAFDPDHYEIAFRWAQAVRFTASDADTERTISQVLRQSRWTEQEEHMIRQLRRPVSG